MEQQRPLDIDYVVLVKISVQELWKGHGTLARPGRARLINIPRITGAGLIYVWGHIPKDRPLTPYLIP